MRLRTIKMPDETWDHLQARAHAERVSASELVRRLIHDGVIAPVVDDRVTAVLVPKPGSDRRR
jgi:hypothetical protein